MEHPAPRIKDNPSHVELMGLSTGMAALARVLGFLEKFGIKHNAISDAMSRVPQIVDEAKRLIELPDNFNDHFASRGWIAHESLNVDLMQRAVDLAVQGQIDAAEQELVAHYTPENMRFTLMRLYNFEPFRIRRELIEKVYEDYASGRYHAVVPLLLATIDGFVNDIEQTGFFAQCTNLTAWDSIAAHSTGLSALCRVFTATRCKTTTEAISVPYRHGILHGRDLGYANQVVAAKSWAALFAVGDWAYAIRNGQKNPKQNEPGPGLFESLRKLVSVQQRNKILSDWSPRTVRVGVCCAASGQPNEYEDGTPEQAIARFVDYWNKRNFGHMAALLKDYSGDSLGVRAGRVRREFGGLEKIGFEIESVQHVAPAIAEVQTAISLSRNGTCKTETVNIRLIYEDEDGEPRAYPGESGVWAIIPGAFSPFIYAW